MLSIGQRLCLSSREARRGHLKSATFIVLLVAAFILSASLVKSAAGASGYELFASAARAGQRSSGRFSGQQPSPDNLQRVTFISDQPKAVIYLRRDGQQFKEFDVTGEDGKVARKLAPGKYFVKAVKPGFGPPEERPIEVLRRPFMTSPPLKVGPRIVTATPTPTPTPAATPTPTPTPETKTITERFFDPATSSQVTLEQWQQRRSAILIEQANTKDDRLLRQLNMELHFVQGQIAYLSGNFRRAIREFADKSFPTNYPQAQFGLGQAYLADGEPERAINAFRQALSNPELAALAYNGISEALTVLEKEDEAATAFARARELGYRSQGGRSLSLNLVRNFVKRGAWDRALKELQGSLAQERSAEVSVMLGEAYLGKGRRIDANKEFEAVIGLGDKVAEAYVARAHYGIAQAAFKEGNRERAFSALESAKALDPDGDLINRDARDTIKKIDEELKKSKERLNRLTVPGKPFMP